jgi:hypothetical protein
MPESDFWRDLAEQFRTVDPQELLRADWTCKVKVGMEETPVLAQWRMVGTDYRTRSVQFAFEALARRGGPKIFPLMESLTGWLEALRQQRLNAENENVAVETNPDGTVASHIYIGSVMRLRQASVGLCKFHESLALETERWADAIKQQKNDPRNWPSVVRYWEGWKALKELTRGPREEIPESAVRAHLAAEHGILPEEVTLGQLQRAAADLSLRYGSVTIIPDVPHQSTHALDSRITEAKVTRPSREERLQQFVTDNDTSIAVVGRTAMVYKANMQQWRREELADSSVMSERIEAVLTGKTPLVTKGKKKG